MNLQSRAPRLGRAQFSIPYSMPDISALPLRRIAAAGFVIMFCFLSARAATSTWDNGGSDSNWNTAANWNPDGVPPSTNDVVIDLAGARVLLTNSVTNLSLTLGGTSAGARTLVFSNWNTTLTLVADVTILTNGVLTLPVAFTNQSAANRIHIACSNLAVKAGGSIIADYLGYAGGPTTSNGYGPGRGASSGTYGAGGGYGGYGGSANNVWPPGLPYGLTNAPEDPGSGGGGGTAGYTGGKGGGAIYIEVTNTVTVNGTITANGGNGGTYCGGGSGGGIYITCSAFLGSNGLICANGGNSGSSTGGDGGGGRIAVVYNPVIQQSMTGLLNAVQFHVKPGAGSGYDGDIGSLYFPDACLLPEIITDMNGQIAGVSTWAPGALLISNCWIRFIQEGFRLTVSNDFIIMGTNSNCQFGGTKGLRTNALANPLTYYYNPTSGPVITIGRDMILTNAATLEIHSGMTNAGTPHYGAIVNVTGNMVIGSNCWIYPHSHSTNGGSVLFQTLNLTISGTNGGFDANTKGYAESSNSIGFGPGGATGLNSGGGYGGRGGDRGGVSGGGNTYGSSNAPIDPGSGGSHGYNTYFCGGNGGGSVWIQAAGVITLKGIITANGATGWGGARSGGGAGGGIFITCQTFTGDSNSVLSAKGGAFGGSTIGGGGGGGRIAVWYRMSEADRSRILAGDMTRVSITNDCSGLSGSPYFTFSGSCSVTNGVGESIDEDGKPGTTIFLTVHPPVGTIFRVY